MKNRPGSIRSGVSYLVSLYQIYTLKYYSLSRSIFTKVGFDSIACAFEEFVDSYSNIVWRNRYTLLLVLCRRRNAKEIDAGLKDSSRRGILQSKDYCVVHNRFATSR
jgi:hypothetical protein